jgi:tRNA dimethylallyltransferase
VLGPTAAGKSEVALRLAEDLGGVILSVDSMQVYRGMDIGTAKPGTEERDRVAHFMLDLVEPSEPFSVADFQATARRVIDQQTRPIVMVGGSGLHFRAVVDPLVFPPHDAELRRRIEEVENPVEALLEADPSAGQHVDLANRRRVVRALEAALITGSGAGERLATPEAEAVRSYRPTHEFRGVLIDPGGALDRRIAARLSEMRARGLLAEVRGLRERMGRTAAAAVGYRQLLAVVAGEVSEEEGWAEVEKATRALARRQRTWFRRDPRLRWVAWDEDPGRRYAAVREALEQV